MARVYILKETTNDPPGDWQLWFQWCRFELEDGNQFGYRFIWRRPTGELQAARGQARIPSIKDAQLLIEKAMSEGWGDRDGNELEKATERLEAGGCVVNLTTGYVGWPDAKTARESFLTEEIIRDERCVREWA
jgi:hypothetical protein